jgi:exonuclease III
MDLNSQQNNIPDNYDYLTDYDTNSSLIFTSNSSEDAPLLDTHNLTLTIWNANGLIRQAISTVTDALSTSDLVFITETWLLSPLRYPTPWAQYHTYGILAEGNGRRGQMGITLLVNPSFAYPVIHIPTASNYIFSCQVSCVLIHCLYLPPSLSDDEFLELLEGLPVQTHASQTNTILCGDFNARSVSLLGDTRTSTRGSKLAEWICENGYYCWNGLLARGQSTLHSINRINNSTRVTTTWSSIVDLFISFNRLVNPKLEILKDSLGSDHLPVSLRFSLPRPPASPAQHPRLVWKLARMNEPDSRSLFKSLFKERTITFKSELVAHIKYAIDIYMYSQSDYVYPHDLILPPLDIDVIATKFTDLLHDCLDDSVGRKTKPPRPPGNSWFWTDALQALVDHRSKTYLVWRAASRSANDIRNAALRADYLEACNRFKAGITKRKRETWKAFCTKLSDGPLADTTAIVKKFRNNRRVCPTFTHPEGPAVAAQTMSNHLRQVFSGDNLPPLRSSAPDPPLGPNLSMDDVRYFCDRYDIRTELPLVNDTAATTSSGRCPFKVDHISFLIKKKLARRKAPGVDHLRAEMLLPILDDVSVLLNLLFSLCWIWCQVPKAWCTAQVVPIFKKGDPFQAANYRPISLTSVLRKLFELCLHEDLLATAPPLDNVQGGFRAERSTLDQALVLHELCRQHTLDHDNTPPVLCFLDIKQAYDSVDRNIIWRALETHVSEPMLGILQGLFDHVQIEVLLAGAKSSSFWPATGVLQGSILSPFLYSIYINSLPTALRSIRRPAARRFDGGLIPHRLFNGLWLNCLLYADDVVLIGTEETMPLLLKKAEEHSNELGYKWNPTKCVVVNEPLYTGDVSPLKLYGTSLPSATSFDYLGLPFNTSAKLDPGLLIARNARSALYSMRTGLQALGIHTPSFSRFVSAQLYSIFIRPKLEYGLAISHINAKNLALLEKAQNQCLRLCFGGHSKSSTAVYKQLTRLPSMYERLHHLVFKNLVRMDSLSADTTLIGSVRDFIHQAPPSRRFQWPKLINTNAIWAHVRSSASPPLPVTINIQQWIEINTEYTMKHFTHFRLSNLQVLLSKVDAPVLLSACRPTIAVDPLLTLPMTTWERSRILRWKMGWLPARPIACRCGHPHASRQHLLACLNVATRLNVPADSLPNPLDFVLNQLPLVKFTPAEFKQRHSQQLIRWSRWWPVLCTIFLEIDMICLPDSEFSDVAQNTEGLTLLSWLLPIHYVPVAPPRRSTLYNYMT